MHFDAVALGGNHVTMDIARGLSTSIDEAERLKTLHASVLLRRSPTSASTIAVTPVGEDERDAPELPAEIACSCSIVRPRVEEILELVRDRLQRVRPRLRGAARSC